MKISVIIPAYNEEVYLPQTLDSVLNQTMSPSDYEVIVINNQSADQTGQILENYSRKYSNLRTATHENQGPGPARNMGMDLAKGDYYFFLDADDLVQKDALESLYDRALSRKADLVVASYEIFTESESHPVRKLEALTRKDEIDSFDPDLLWTFSLWNKLFSASPIREGKLRFSDLIYSEDGLFFMQYLSVCGKITGLDQTVLRYRKAPSGKQSITGSFSDRKLRDYLEAHRLMRSVLRKRLADKPKLPGKDARILMQEFSYKELYVLIDQFYRHYWSMDETTRRHVSRAVSARLHAIDDAGYIRTIQQWPDIDFSKVGHETRESIPDDTKTSPAAPKSLPSRVISKVRREAQKWIFLHNPHRHRL